MKSEPMNSSNTDVVNIRVFPTPEYSEPWTTASVDVHKGLNDDINTGNINVETAYPPFEDTMRHNEFTGKAFIVSKMKPGNKESIYCSDHTTQIQTFPNVSMKNYSFLKNPVIARIKREELQLQHLRVKVNRT